MASRSRSTDACSVLSMRAIGLVCVMSAIGGCGALLPSLQRQPRTVPHSIRPGRLQSDCFGRASTALDARGKSRRRRRRRRPRHGTDQDLDLEDCVFLDRSEVDGFRLAKSIDDEYAVEEAKRDLSFWQVLDRERKRKPEDISEKSRDMSAWARTKRRMTYARGDTESKYALMADRTYGEPELLDQDHLDNPPSLDDLNQRPSPFKDTYWSAPFFRIGVVAFSYVVMFPLLLNVFDKFQTIDPEDFDLVVGQIAPNVGVLYATILALTLQVLYERFTRIQENVTTEAMLLSQVTRNILSLFATEKDWAIEACQVVANQVRIMLSRTRGVELLSIMKADTYANLLSIVDDYHYLHGCDDDFTAQEESVTNMLRGEIGQLMEVRALRLSDEASSLPPTHFLLITSLSFVSIVAYVTASFKVVDDLMHPPQEASLLFSGLLALYVLFFNFCKDLNGPFVGVYQIKRSNAVSHLMQTKWLIVSQLGDSVNFNVNYGSEPEVEEEKSFMDKVKAFFSGSEAEDVREVESATMQMLVEELESAVETVGEDDDLCDSLPMAASLDCSDDGRFEKLQKLQDELARLKDLQHQVTNGGVEVSLDSTDPASRLRRMEEELDRLKHLRQINHELSLGQVSSQSVAIPHVAVRAGTGQTISAARAALEQASFETLAAEKALAEAVSSEPQSVATKPITDKATGVAFDPKLDDLYLVGVGVRKKAIINIYSLGMYSSQSTLAALSPFSPGQDAKVALRNAARTFGTSTPTTSFVLQMVFKADASTIAGAIADSVKPRYDGPAADVKMLETLISDGVKSKGGQATKGTVFRFDCSEKGVSVSVDGKMQGVASFEGIGSAFVDVFMDDKAVSPQLVESCMNTWCGSGIHQEVKKAEESLGSLKIRVNDAHAKEQNARRALDDLESMQRQEREVVRVAVKPSDDQLLLEQAQEEFKAEGQRRAKEAAEQAAAEEAKRRCGAIESKMMPMKERATGVSFDPKLAEGLYLVGVGVRKKAIINVYALAAYSSPAAMMALSQYPRGKQKQEAQTSLRNAARTFDAFTPTTSFVLEMVFKADAATIAGAIAEGVKPRYGGPPADVKELESLIIDGLKSKGGQATKGTVFRFDCNNEGVSVSVDGNMQGTARFEGMGSAFVDVFMDEKAVSPQLVDSCINSWCGSDLM